MKEKNGLCFSQMSVAKCDGIHQQQKAKGTQYKTSLPLLSSFKARSQVFVLEKYFFIAVLVAKNV